MDVHTQRAAVGTNVSSKCLLHGRKGVRRAKHFTQFLTCRTTPQKVQATNHSATKSTHQSWVRKHSQLHIAAEIARSPAAPGLLFTAAAVKGFSVASEVVSNLVDRGSVKAEKLGADITRQLQQASDRIAVQTEVSQNSFQEWKGLMSGILSEEASKVQTELDHASKTLAVWQQQSSEMISQVRDSSSEKRDGLKAHPLSLPQIKVSELESGWLVDAFHQRFPDIGSSSAWPTSFSVAAGSDSSSDGMSVSDDEDAKTPFSPTSLVSRFMDQARDLTERPFDKSSRGTAVLDTPGLPSGSAVSDFASTMMSRAMQFTGQRFNVSSFSPNGGPSGSKQLSEPASPTALLPSPDKSEAAAQPTASASATAAAPSVPSPPQAASPHMTTSVPKSEHTNSTAQSSSLLLVKTAKSQQSIAQTSPTAGKHADSSASQDAGPVKLSGKSAVPAKVGNLSTAPASQKSLTTVPAKMKQSSLTPVMNDRSSTVPARADQKPVPVSLKPDSLQQSESRDTAAIPAASAEPRRAAKHTQSAGEASSSTASAAPPHPPAPSQQVAQESFKTSAAPDHMRSPAAPSQIPPSALSSQAPSSVHNPAPSPSSPAAASASSALPEAGASTTAPVSAEQASSAPKQSPAADGQGLAVGPADKTQASRQASWKTKGFAPRNSSASAAHKSLAPKSPKSATGTEPPVKPQAAAPQAKGSQVSSKTDGAGAHATSTGSQVETKPPQLQPTSAAKEAARDPLQPGDAVSAAAQGFDQRKDGSKAPLKPVKVVRPAPTPNWRTPRPLTPPPTPVQQGHPLSASPAAGGRQAGPDLQSADASGNSQAGASLDKADGAVASFTGPNSPQEPVASSSTDVIKDSGALRPSSPSKSIPLDPSTDAGLQSPSTAEITDESGTGRQPNIAAATAVDSDTTTTVIDSIPWGTSGTATTKGQSASPQAGGGGGSITGGTTGGGGSGSSRPSGDSGGGDDGDRSSSSWQQWWVRLLLASGGATAVSLLSSTVREALQSAMITVKSKFAPVTGKLHEEDQEEQTTPEADQEQGIATNIKVKEGDTAWSIAEEYKGRGTAWPEVVSSNSAVDTARPKTGTTLRVSVRL